MESIYYRPRNGALQKVFVSEVKNRTVFKFQRRESEESDPSEDINESAPANLSGKVIKLYDQCMELLSNYTHCFESLIDFPEDFGKEIFEKAVNKLIVDNESTKKTVQIYCEAYPESFLPQCKLTDMLMINNFELCLPMIITSTAKLDLTRCELDDDHDLLGHLVHMNMLESLSLAENQLTDRGLRRLLLPAAGGKYLARLTYLDLAGNRLDRKALARINLVKSLSTIVLGEKDFQLKEIETTLKNCFRLRKCPRFEKIETSGFGSQLLDAWSDKSKVKVKAKKPKTEGFYSKPPCVLGSSGTASEFFLAVSKNKLMFERVKVLGVVKVNNISKTDQATKRKVQLEDAKIVKKIKVSTSDEFDQNLLSLYM